MVEYDFFLEKELPFAISKSETKKYFESYHAGNALAREKLILHNLRLVLLVVHKKFDDRSCYTKYEVKDLVSIGIMGLVKAVDSFDLSKNITFSTYATRCIANEISMYLRSLNRQKRSGIEISLDSPVDVDKYGENLKIEDILFDETYDIASEYLNQSLHDIVRQLVEELPDKYRELIKLYFGFTKEGSIIQPELVKRFHCSQANISRNISDGIILIKRELIRQRIIEPTVKKHKCKRKPVKQ